MDCALIEPELIGFHFGLLDDERRLAVERHLCGCARCLRAFLEVKRALERGAEATPSPESRARLRAAVAEELDRRRAASPLRRRLALPLAVAAALVLAFFVGGAVQRRSATPGPGAVPHAAPAGPATTIDAVDTIHSAPTSLDVL